MFYVTSMMADSGQALADIASSEPTPWMDPGADGTVGVHADIVRELFLQDCDEATQREALERLTRQSAAPFTQPPRQVAWHDTPSTYFVCTEDLAIPADVQRQRASDDARMIDVPTGHHPSSHNPTPSRSFSSRRSVSARPAPRCDPADEPTLFLYDGGIVPDPEGPSPEAMPTRPLRHRGQGAVPGVARAERSRRDDARVEARLSRPPGRRCARPGCECYRLRRWHFALARTPSAVTTERCRCAPIARAWRRRSATT